VERVFKPAHSLGGSQTLLLVMEVMK